MPVFNSGALVTVLIVGSVLLLNAPAAAQPRAEPQPGSWLDAWRDIERLEVRRIVETRVEGQEGQNDLRVCEITFEVNVAAGSLTLTPTRDASLFQRVIDPALFPAHVERLNCLVPTLRIDAAGRVMAPDAKEIAEQVDAFFEHFIAAQPGREEQERVRQRTRGSRQSLSTSALETSAQTWWSMLGLRPSDFAAADSQPSPCLEPTPAAVLCTEVQTEDTRDLSEAMEAMYQGAGFRLVRALAHQQATVRFRSDQAPPTTYFRRIRQAQDLVHRYTDEKARVTATNLEFLVIGVVRPPGER